MGFSTPLREVFSFIYMAPFDNGLTEHEYDHILVGEYDAPPLINKEEVEHWKWMGLEDIKNDINKNPHHYTEWFKIIFNKYDDHIKLQPHESKG